ncbi:MAG: class I SAM-dependent methyltransferase [Solirubrobacteraceae bacterium]
MGTAEAPPLLSLQDTLYNSQNPTRRWLHVSRRESIHEALRGAAAAQPLDRVLEVGPGSGVYLPVLSELAGTVVASDIEPAFLDRARELAASRSNVEVVLDDIVASDLPSASFDLVLCSEVIEHIPDPAAALASMHRILRPGGRLLLSTPHRFSPLELAGRVAFLPGVLQIVRRIYREPVLPTGHISLVSGAEMRRRLAAAGFAVERSWATGVYLPVVAELTGRAGLRLEQRLERRLAATRLAELLWTQYHLAVR